MCAALAPRASVGFGFGFLIVEVEVGGALEDAEVVKGVLKLASVSNREIASEKERRTRL